MGYDIPASAAEIAHWQAGAISRAQLLDCRAKHSADHRTPRSAGAGSSFTGASTRSSAVCRHARRGCGPRFSAPARVPCSAIRPRLSCTDSSTPRPMRSTSPSRRPGASRLGASSSARRAASSRPGSLTGRRLGPASRKRCWIWFSSPLGSTTPAAGLPRPALSGSPRRKSSGPRWPCARKCAGAPSSMMSSPQRAAEFTPCWNTGTCATSSAPTACRDPGIRCASSSTARWSTGTCTTTSIRSPSSWTDGWRIRTTSAGATAIGTPRPARKGCRRAATAGVTSTLTPAETALLQAQILRRRGWRGTPKPCSAGCPVGRAFSQVSEVSRGSQASQVGQRKGA